MRPLKRLIGLVSSDLKELAQFLEGHTYAETSQMAAKRWGRELDTSTLQRFRERYESYLVIIPALENAEAASELVEYAATSKPQFSPATLFLIENRAFDLAKGLSRETNPTDPDELLKVTTVIHRSKLDSTRERMAAVQERKCALRQKEFQFKHAPPKQPDHEKIVENTYKTISRVHARHPLFELISQKQHEDRIAELKAEAVRDFGGANSNEPPDNAGGQVGSAVLSAPCAPQADRAHYAPPTAPPTTAPITNKQSSIRNSQSSPAGHIRPQTSQSPNNRSSAAPPTGSNTATHPKQGRDAFHGVPQQIQPSPTTRNLSPGPSPQTSTPPPTTIDPSSLPHAEFYQSLPADPTLSHHLRRLTSYVRCQPGQPEPFRDETWKDECPCGTPFPCPNHPHLYHSARYLNPNKPDYAEILLQHGIVLPQTVDKKTT